MIFLASTSDNWVIAAKTFGENVLLFNSISNGTSGYNEGNWNWQSNSLYGVFLKQKRAYKWQRSQSCLKM